MAAILRTPSILLPPTHRSSTCPDIPKGLPVLHLRQRPRRPHQLKLAPLPRQPLRLRTLVPLPAYGEATETDAVEETTTEESSEDEVAAENGANDGAAASVEDKQMSLVMATFRSYQEALANDDQSTISEIESFLQSIEDEKNSLANKVATLSEELSTERDRILRISADFENFRKRTERERLSLMTNVQGELVESLLPVLDNFERAKSQIKVETEREEKINNSYQSIYKQFVEILSSLGVEAVETVGNAFDPMLHEAIMSEDSMEFEEGIILQEFRKGFKIGDRLLRPSMVKVSAGPGPAKSEDAPAQSPGSSSEVTSQEGSEEAGEVV
uniref:GrpE protein homolog n=1 Tax=Anthurium amnicola TaxID=1678845 RepID=A0A1D1XME2_9ARAE